MVGPPPASTANSARLSVLRWGVAVAMFVGLVGTGCSPSDSSDAPARSAEVKTTTLPTTPPTTIPPMTELPTTELPTTVLPTTVLPTTVPPRTSGETTAVPTTAAAPVDELIGMSVNGLPITVTRRGTSGGVAVAVVGSIHGNEESGMRITAALRDAVIPDGIELWLIDTINPDGVAVGQRRNAHGVDLNRNFPGDWTSITEPAYQYSGSGPASEPETQAFVAFAQSIRPALTIWYHEDLNAIAPSTGSDWPLRLRYSELSGIPIGQVTQPGGVYTGTAATWTKTTAAGGMSFVIELPDTLTDEQLAANTAALLAITTMVPGAASSG